MKQSLAYYAGVVGNYWTQSNTVGDFVRLTHVRLSQSKLGPLVCPRPMRTTVFIKAYGGPVTLRSHTTDSSVNDELLVSGGYDMLLRHLPRTIRTVIDLGANVGLASRWLLNAFPESRVIAVEPEPGNLEMLRQNSRGHPIDVFGVAIGANPREALMFTRSGEHGFTIADKPRPDDRTTVVSVERMEHILASSGSDAVDLLKVDVEGAEAEIFSDCAAWIHRVDWLMIECHQGFSLDDLLAMIAAQGTEFDVIEREPKSAWGFEVGLLRRRGRVAAVALG